MSFLPKDYKSPIASNNYMKMNEGENRIRILSQPIMGWEDWKDNKPVRFTLTEKPSMPVSKEKPIKHFWAFVIYNVVENQIQIMQVTQNTIIKSIESLCKDADWGNPYHYDIKIKKSGKGMETQYVVSPVPHKPIDPVVADMFHAKPCNLDAMFNSADPFSTEWKIHTPLALSLGEEVEKESPTNDVYISADQVSIMEKLINECDPKRHEVIRDYLRRQCGGKDDMTLLRKDKFANIIKFLNERMNEYKTSYSKTVGTNEIKNAL